MALTRSCDKCSRTITDDNPVVIKLFMSPVVKGKTRNQHSDYSAHMDIGKCCADPILKLGKWQKRVTQARYHNGRKLRAADTVEAGDKRTTGKTK